MASMMTWIIVLRILMRTRKMQMAMESGMFVIAARILTVTALAIRDFLRMPAHQIIALIHTTWLRPMLMLIVLGMSAILNLKYMIPPYLTYTHHKATA
jgi:hypothetical protein